MTEKEVKIRIDLIKEEKDDDEVAHGFEDQLYFDFVKHIASLDYETLEETCHSIQRMAEEILKTEDIDFCRWCA